MLDLIVHLLGARSANDRGNFLETNVEEFEEKIKWLIVLLLDT